MNYLRVREISIAIFNNYNILLAVVHPFRARSDAAPDGPPPPARSEYEYDTVRIVFTLFDIEPSVDNRERVGRVVRPRVRYEIPQLVLQRFFGLVALGIDVHHGPYEKLVVARPANKN